MIGILDWVGTKTPTKDDLRGASIVEQGLTDIEAIDGDNSLVLGNMSLPATVSGISNFRNFEIGTVTHTYGYKNLSNTIERILKV